MKATDIQQLLRVADPSDRPQLIETHISWVLLRGDFAYKIKKPVRFDFLDTASLAARRHLCQEELRLNRRLAPEMYLSVVPVRQTPAGPVIGGPEGPVCDYSVKMRRYDPQDQLDVALRRGAVSPQAIAQLGAQHRAFFAQAPEVRVSPQPPAAHRFQGLGHLLPFLGQYLGTRLVQQTQASLWAGRQAGRRLLPLMALRQQEGWVRDLHGDLHSANIFLKPRPTVFDCLEFSPAMRQLDLLDEAAFLGMDFCAQGHPELETVFLKALLPEGYPFSPHVKPLYQYFKWYRAFVRAKVHALQARLAPDPKHLERALTNCQRYLNLMSHYSRTQDNIRLFS
ncbi:MAG: hypothetical protein D6722_02000 [Bacteroidetes bacterium]|nr:MAG: hypothetical protein D6722_02000 [Bacteroidota bacterium]